MGNKHLFSQVKKARKSFPDIENSRRQGPVVHRSLVHWWDSAKVGGIHSLEGEEVIGCKARGGGSQNLPGIAVALKAFILKEQGSHREDFSRELSGPGFFQGAV